MKDSDYMTRKQKKNLIRIIISLVLFLIIFMVDKIIVLGDVFSGKCRFILPFCLYLIVYIIIGYDVLKKAFLNIVHGSVLDENFLMTIATLGAFSLAIYNGVNGSEIEGFDEGCAVLLFYQVGEWFQNYAVHKTRRSITSLMDIRPDYANLKEEENIKVVSPEEVNIGDRIIVYPSEKVPLDGTVIKGCSSIDTKALTGESMPADVLPGAEILSGSINLLSTIEIKVNKVFYDSTVSKILDLVENASNRKSNAEDFISKFAKFYTPIVVICAMLLALIPSIITKNPSLWIYRALSFLVVSCPCALVISIPLSFFAGLGAASKHGVLIKGSNYLEKLSKVNVFVFDKTGTLTKGNFKVTKIFPENNKDEILKYAAIAEKDSNHPISIAIKNEYKSNIENDFVITNYPGKGIAANGKYEILCGNHLLMEDNDIEYIKENEIGSICHVALNKKYLGYIVVADEIRDEASLLIGSLNKQNIKSIMLTGDNEAIASYVSKKLNLTEYKSSLLPNNKVEEVNKLLNNKDTLCFVGDGINDAPVLMASDIGISMGSIGSDAAIEASDIVLMNDDLNSIVIARKISKKTMRIVFENIFFALIVKLLILILSAIGITNMWFAVFGDVGVALIAIINALRVNSKYLDKE